MAGYDLAVGAAPERGFSADVSVTVHMAGLEGQLSTTAPVTITFYEPEITAARRWGPGC